MHLFSDYIQPLTTWLHDHPHLALFITFFIAMTESLAIIGSLVPGSVTMTAIGILAGSGVMRIDLTLIAATLGAIAGDSASYLLGYTFSDRIVNIWPFNRYPNWLDYGKKYFARHGGKSVLLGRFIGPLRSLIPIIAGMVHMSHWRFYVANIISAIGWAVLYVVPGVLIGAASSELSPESATRLFILILILLVGIWLLSVALKWLFIRLNRLLSRNFNRFWLWASKNYYFATVINFLTPINETNHYSTATLFLLAIVSSTLFIILAIMIDSSSAIVNFNQAVYLLFQSLRTYPFDLFFILISQITSIATLTILSVMVIFLAIYKKDWRSLFYWLSINVCCFFIITISHLIITNAQPLNLWVSGLNNSFPITNLTLATAFFVTIIFYTNSYSNSRFNHVLTIVFSISLLLSGLTPIYFGDNFITDSLGAYLAGLAISITHWLLYRRDCSQLKCSPSFVFLFVFIIVIASIFSSLYTYSDSMRKHQPHFAQYVLTNEIWWNQTTPLLPIYRTNRIGRPIGLFNIEYAGKLNSFEEHLKAQGWQKQSGTLFSSLLTRVNKQTSSQELPLIAQLYLNKKPVLIMTYKPANGGQVQILRLWRSNYHLLHFHQPIWLGSVHSLALPGKKISTSQNKKALKINSIDYVKSSLPQFMQRTLLLPTKQFHKRLPDDTEPMLLLLKEKPFYD